MEKVKVLYRVEVKNVNFKNIPNDTEYYFVIDFAGNKRVHKGGHIKRNPREFKFIFLDAEQI
jgi:hypothetical protein